jgi:hypothetical protein
MMRKTFPSDRVPRSRHEIGSIPVSPELQERLTNAAAAAGMSRRAYCDWLVNSLLTGLGAPDELPPVVPITTKLLSNVIKRAKRSNRSRREVFEQALVHALDKAGAP